MISTIRTAVDSGENWQLTNKLESIILLILTKPNLENQIQQAFQSPTVATPYNPY
ncbi:hypothetical protein [Nostoc phage YongM]|nr:hypothetical protein [Nostoc phage YongM]